MILAWSGDGVDDAGVDNNSSTSKTAEVGLPWGSSYTKVPQPRFNKEFVHVAVECDAPPPSPIHPCHRPPKRQECGPEEEKGGIRNRETRVAQICRIR